MTDALTEMAAAVVQSSPALQSRVASFVEDTLDRAIDLMENGTPKMQADLINKLVPHLVRQLADKAEDDEVKAMRADMAELRQSMQGQVGVGRERMEEDAGVTDTDRADARARILALIPRDKPSNPPPGTITQATGSSVRISRRES